MKEVRTCRVCKEDKPLSKFRKFGPKSNNWRMHECNDCRNESTMEQYRTDSKTRAQLIVNARRYQAKKKGIPFDLDWQWMQEKIDRGICEATGLPLTMDVGKRDGTADPFSPSIDRIDPDGPYSLENSRVVCYVFNLSRSAFGDDVFYKMCRAFMDKYESQMNKAA